MDTTWTHGIRRTLSKVLLGELILGTGGKVGGVSSYSSVRTPRVETLFTEDDCGPLRITSTATMLSLEAQINPKTCLNARIALQKVGFMKISL